MVVVRRPKNSFIHPTPVLIMAVAVFLLSLAARAATVTGFSDIQTRLQHGTASDHEIKFVTPTGVDTSSDTITLTFSSGYAMGSVAFDDMDFAVDSSAPTNDCGGAFTDKTLAASAAAGTWGASVSGQVITLTAPTDAAAGEVAAGVCVRLKVGTNATVGATGNSQITNPSSGTSGTLTLAGTFGDTGTAFLHLTDSDQVTVTATVATTGGGGGPTCPPTCPPPVISNVRAQNITDTGADILWETDISSTSFVDYGTTVSYGSTASVGGSTFNHSVPLSSLTPGTLYHYRVRSAGSGTSETVSGDFTFTTTDSTAPVITNVQAVDITGTTARITWDTDEDADSRVDYGFSEPYPNFVFNGTLTNAHSLNLTGLTPNSTYRYRVTSKDASSNSSTSVEFTFVTLDTVPPVISSITVTNITTSSAQVNWTTDELANSRVDYGTTISYGSTVAETGLVANHQVLIASLVPNTLYHFRVSSHDASGNGATSTDQTFTSAADTTPPANVSNFTATPASQQNTLTWTNPVDADFTGVRIKRSTTGFPASPTSGTTVFDGIGTSTVDAGLVNGTTYFYTAFAYDSSGNFASGAAASGTPFDTVPPGPVTSFIVVAGDGQNVLSWTNPPDADFSNVVIRRSTSTFPPGPNDGTGIYSGAGTSFTDTGLANGTTYYYAIFARDTSNNFSSGAQGSGTPSAPPPPPPVCGDGLCQAPENSASCPADCVAAPVCGNASCEPPEDNASCPADCPPAPPPPPAEFCGNGICGTGEDFNSCPADCPAPPGPPVPTPEPTATPAIDPAQIEYYAYNRALRLQPYATGDFRILPGVTMTIVARTSIFPRPARSLMLNFNSGSFLFRKESVGGRVAAGEDDDGWVRITRAAEIAQASAEDAWVTDVSAPVLPGDYHGDIVVTYEDDSVEVVSFAVRIMARGYVYENVDGVETRVAGAVVTLKQGGGSSASVWNAAPFLQQNPTTTDAQGAYAFMVPEGTYRLEVMKPGYRTSVSAPFTVDGNVVNTPIELLKLPPSLTEVIIPGAPITENIGNVARAIGGQTVYITKVIRKEIVEDPRVKQTTRFAVVPAAAAVTTAVVFTAVQATTIINYLYFLLTQPILLIARRKRKEYGVVYNSLSKLPIDLAIVRLFRADGRLVRTLVTDKQGRYAFLVEPGEYRIEASKQRFQFPTEVLKDRREDFQYVDLYHGETIRVGESGAVITANIPMDPLEIVKSARRLILEEIGRKIQNFLAPLSVVLTVVAFIAYREIYLFVLSVIQFALYLLFRRLARPRRPKNWGIIYDEKTKKPVPYAVARIVETQYNKILESRVTDSRGRYNFLVGNNKYYVTVEKPGYETAKTADIDLTTAEKGGGVVGVDIPLKEKQTE